MFATKNDLAELMTTDRLDQITYDPVEPQVKIIDNALRKAESTIIHALSSPGYDYLTILGKTGDDRDPTVLSWILSIAVYRLYKRIPDEQIPGSVVMEYRDTKETLKLISLGSISTALPKLSTPEGRPKTKFRYGFDKRRSSF